MEVRYNKFRTRSRSGEKVVIPIIAFIITIFIALITIGILMNRNSITELTTTTSATSSGDEPVATAAKYYQPATKATKFYKETATSSGNDPVTTATKYHTDSSTSDVTSNESTATIFNKAPFSMASEAAMTVKAETVTQATSKSIKELSATQHKFNVTTIGNIKSDTSITARKSTPRLAKLTTTTTVLPPLRTVANRTVQRVDTSGTAGRSGPCKIDHIFPGCYWFYETYSGYREASGVCLWHHSIPAIIESEEMFTQVTGIIRADMKRAGNEGTPTVWTGMTVDENGTITTPPPYYVKWNPYRPFLGPRYKFPNIMLVVIRDINSSYNGMSNAQTWVELRGVVCQWTGESRVKFLEWLDYLSDTTRTWW